MSSEEMLLEKHQADNEALDFQYQEEQRQQQLLAEMQAEHNREDADQADRSYEVNENE